MENIADTHSNYTELHTLYENALIEEKQRVYRNMTLSIFNSAMNILNEAKVPNKIITKDYTPKFQRVADNDKQVFELVNKLKEEVSTYEENLFKKWLY